MARQATVVLGREVTVEGEAWVLWSDGSKAGRYWAFQRREGATRWLEVRYVTGADGRKAWLACRD